MSNHPTRTRKSMELLLALVCLTLGLAVPVAAQECKIFKLEIPKTDTFKLPNGEHVIASTMTERGKLEVRTTVQASKAISPFELYLAGKIMKETPQSRVHKSNLDCLKKQLPPGRTIANSRGPLFRLDCADGSCCSSDEVYSMCPPWHFL